MIISDIKLKNFRCHSEYDLHCTDETTLILGPNGCGKTSVLEAVNIALAGKSFRIGDTEILKRGCDFYRIEVGFSNKDKVVVVYNGETKEFRVGDKKTRRLAKKNRYPVILFEPDDLHLIGSSPKNRRDYFDRLISQMDDKYSSLLSKYKKALTQRNEILKAGVNETSVLFPWNELLVKLGTAISARRERVVKLINNDLGGGYQKIAKNQDAVRLSYETSVRGDEDEYRSELEAALMRDVVLGHTSYGIHKDDFWFYFNDKKADGSASRGEIRTMILALKFIEAEMLEKNMGKKPLIMLDDVFSELDGSRQEALKNNFKDNQILITSVK